MTEMAMTPAQSAPRKQLTATQPRSRSPLRKGSRGPFSAEFRARCPSSSLRRSLPRGTQRASEGIRQKTAMMAMTANMVAARAGNAVSPADAPKLTGMAKYRMNSTQYNAAMDRDAAASGAQALDSQAINARLKAAR